MNQASRLAAVRKPWYREPWPWLLMLAPLSAVLFGCTMLWVAVEYRDPLVTEHAWEEGQKMELPNPHAAGAAAQHPLSARP